MIENGYIIALNDDAIEVGGAIPCNFKATSEGKIFDRKRGNDGNFIYTDAKVLIVADEFQFDGCAVYDLNKRLIGNFLVGQRIYNSQVGLYEMKLIRHS